MDMMPGVELGYDVRVKHSMPLGTHDFRIPNQGFYFHVQFYVQLIFTYFFCM